MSTRSDIFTPEPEAEEQELPEIGPIIVKRRDPQGGWSEHPRRFTADELPDLRSVHQRWGGGVYNFKARTTNNQHWKAERTITLAGRPGPFPEDDAPPQAAGNAEPPPLPRAPVDMTNPNALVALILQQGQAAATAQQSMMMGLLNTVATIGAAIAGRPAAPQDGGLAAMAQTLAQQAAADRSASMAMLRDLAATRSGGPGGDTLTTKDAFELGTALAEAKSGGRSDVLNTFAEAFAANIAHKAAGSGAP